MKEEQQNPEQIPDNVLRRLPKYLAVSQVLEGMGWDFVTSADLARACEVKEMLVRKDLAWTGVVGRPRFGYPIHGLIGAILDVVGWNRQRTIAFVGKADIATALTKSFPFSRYGLQLTCVVDDASAGSSAAGVPALSLSDFLAQQATEPVAIALIAIPPEQAQSVADRLVSAGVKGIWNFAATTIAVPDDVRVVDADLASSLAILCYELVRIGQ